MRNSYQEVLDAAGVEGHFDAHTGSVEIVVPGTSQMILVSDPQTVRELTGFDVADSWLISREDESGEPIIQTIAPSQEALIEKLKTLLTLEV